MIIPSTDTQMKEMELNSIIHAKRTVLELIKKLGEKDGGELRISYDPQGKNRKHNDINLGYPDVAKVVTELLNGISYLSDTEILATHDLLTHTSLENTQDIRKHIVYRLAEIFGGKDN